MENQKLAAGDFTLVENYTKQYLGPVPAASETGVNTLQDLLDTTEGIYTNWLFLDPATTPRVDTVEVIFISCETNANKIKLYLGPADGLEVGEVEHYYIKSPSNNVANAGFWYISFEPDLSATGLPDLVKTTVVHDSDLETEEAEKKRKAKSAPVAALGGGEHTT